MTEYATPEELATWIDPDATDPTPPPNAMLLLRTAAATIESCTMGSVYTIGTDGLPTAAPAALAMKHAVLQQAADLATNGIDPTKADGGLRPEVASKSLAGMSVSYVQNGAAAATRAALAGGQVSPGAWGYLDRAGLLTSRVSTLPGVGIDTYLLPGPFDTSTGRLLGT